MKERTKRVLKFLTIFVGTAIVCLGGFIYWVGWLLGPGMCGHQPPQVTMSPDGKHQALIFEGDCGATDHFHTYVSVLPKGKSLGEHELGNAFGIKENQIVSVRWADATHLHVEYPVQAEAQVHFRKSSINGVYIEYAGVQ
jgi:hypothetical protein